MQISLVNPMTMGILVPELFTGTHSASSRYPDVVEFIFFVERPKDGVGS
jgi:hypothetical protein